MKTEKIVLYLAATLLGLLVAGAAFFVFSSKPNPPSKTKVITISPTPSTAPSILLNLDQPKDEDVVSKKTITVSGETRSDATIVILTNGIENVISPSASGNFSTQITLSNDQNIIEIIAIAANGETKSIKRTITFSEEDF